MTCSPLFRSSYFATLIALGSFGIGMVALLPSVARAADVVEYPEPTPEPPPVDPPPVDPPDPSACTVPSLDSINIDQSLVVHDQATLGTGFEFSKTIGAILQSASLPNDQAAKEAFVKTILDSFDDTEAENTGLRMSIDPRPDEFALLAKNLLDPANKHGMVPTGLFNRIDLAPKSFADCGEHRIVYSFKAPNNPPFERFFLIFEARLPNPDAATKAPGQKADPKACVDVAKFWAGLTGLSAAERNARLQQFYYGGLPGSTGPVVSASNYGDLLGQVRSNQFQQQPWLLREWRVQTNAGTGALSFKVDTVKANPLAELYSANANGALEPVEQEALRQTFQTELLSKYVKEIVEVDTQANVTAEDILNGFGIVSDIRKFNEFQSESQNGTDVPAPDPALVSLIQAAVPAGVSVTGAEVVNRLNAITCQGCHEQAPGQEIGKIGSGPTILWPTTLGFVHIAEPVGAVSALSPALTDSFLPFRRKVLAVSHCVKPEDVDPLPANAANATLSDLAANIAVVRGGEADDAAKQQVVRTRDAIQAASDAEEGFFVRARRPH
jgi:hypothetical protein